MERDSIQKPNAVVVQITPGGLLLDERVWLCLDILYIAKLIYL